MQCDDIKMLTGNDDDPRWRARLRAKELAHFSMACSVMSLVVAVLSLPVQWKWSQFPFGDNDFDPIGIVLLLLGICCFVFCWLPAIAGLLTGLIALFPSYSRRLAAWSIMSSLTALAIYHFAL